MKIKIGVMCSPCGTFQDVELEIEDVEILKSISMHQEKELNKVIDAINYLTEEERHLFKYHECWKCEIESSGLNDGLDDGTWEELNG